MPIDFCLEMLTNIDELMALQKLNKHNSIKLNFFSVIFRTNPNQLILYYDYIYYIKYQFKTTKQLYNLFGFGVSIILKY